MYACRRACILDFYFSYLIFFLWVYQSITWEASLVKSSSRMNKKSLKVAWQCLTINIGKIQKLKGKHYWTIRHEKEAFSNLWEQDLACWYCKGVDMMRRGIVQCLTNYKKKMLFFSLYFFSGAFVFLNFLEYGFQCPFSKAWKEKHGPSHPKNVVEPSKIFA